MDTRIALIGIVLNSTESVDELNHLLSEYSNYIIGRMGIPYREKICPLSASLWMRLPMPSVHSQVNWVCFQASAPKQFMQSKIRRKANV